jgi:hypothetical protein
MLEAGYDGSRRGSINIVLHCGTAATHEADLSESAAVCRAGEYQLMLIT